MKLADSKLGGLGRVEWGMGMIKIQGICARNSQREAIKILLRKELDLSSSSEISKETCEKFPFTLFLARISI